MNFDIGAEKNAIKTNKLTKSCHKKQGLITAVKIFFSCYDDSTGKMWGS